MMRYVVLKYRTRYVAIAAVGDDSLLAQALGDDNYDFPLSTSGTGMEPSMILERLEHQDDSYVSFRTTSGSYVSADHDWTGEDDGVRWLGVGEAGGLFLRRREQPGQQETFREIWFQDHVALQTYKGLFVTAEGGGKGAPLSINRSEIGEWQLFDYEVPPTELLPKEPTVADRLKGGVDEAERHVHIPGAPEARTTVAEGKNARINLPGALRDKLFRPPGGH